MDNAEAAGEGSHLGGEDCVGWGLADQPLEGDAIPNACPLLEGIRHRKARASARDVGKFMDAEGIALANEQCGAAIAREETRLRLDYTQPMHLAQWLGPGHDHIGV